MSCHTWKRSSGENGRRISRLSNVRKDGKHINTSFTLAPVRDARGEVVAAAVIIRGLDERKKAELALARSEQRYALVAKKLKRRALGLGPDHQRGVLFTALERPAGLSGGCLGLVVR